MIVLEKMSWSNCFSYGVGNTIDFTTNPITQLVGGNGNGKSSIPLILELALFNKNSKGIKTGDILNRYTDDKFYIISLDFTKDGKSYNIFTRRTSTQVVKLLCDGEDISAHTPTNTFKLIEEILGFDHKSFCQLVYQSSAQSLEFLTATDTTRKNFLIKLLNLEKYSEAADVFKDITKSAKDDVTKAEAAVATISAWVNKHIALDLSLKVLNEVPTNPTALIEAKAKVAEEIRTITAINNTIETNNKYKSLLDSIDLSQLQTDPPFLDDYTLVQEKAVFEAQVKDATSFIAKVKALKSKCPTCSHPIDNSKQLELVSEKESTFAKASAAVKILAAKISEIAVGNKIIVSNASVKSKWEQYNSHYDGSLNSQKLDKIDLDNRVVALTSEISECELKIASITKANTLVLQHNTKASVIAGQLVDMSADLVKAKTMLTKVTSRLVTLQILSKAFSTNGLVAFKIESMIKDLELLVNEYLADLSYGRFQLEFLISGEKLNVVISDNGYTVDMFALSSGERARVNTATLLAIRKLMQNLSNTKINLLILDETLDNLDVEGKEKLIEILVGEEHLNTFLVSHGFTHPLLEKIEVIKENNISRLEQ